MNKILCFVGLLLLAGSARAVLPVEEAQALSDILLVWPVLSTHGWTAGGETNACESQWFGLTCDPTNSTVTGLWLSSLELNGTIPDAVAHLPNLSSLQLETCGLTGPIPASLGTLANLAVLNLAANSLTGTVPTGLVALTYDHLSDLNLSNNQLELCGNPDLNSTSVSPGILSCSVADQVPTPCGCPGVWTHCLTIDIENCGVPSETTPTGETTPTETSTPESSEPHASVPETTVPQAETPQTSAPVQSPTASEPIVIVIPQAQPTSAPVPESVPAPIITPTGNSPQTTPTPNTASGLTLSTLAAVALAAIVLAAN